MRRFALSILASASTLLAACATTTAATPADTGGFNAELAERLGADEYGMKSYVLVTLKTGPNDATITDAEERSAIFRGHFSNMKELAEQGKLALSGPYMDAAPKRGLYIFNVTTIDDAKALVQTDPAVAAGIFIAEFDKLYASAAVMEVNNIHLTIQKTAVE